MSRHGEVYWEGKENEVEEGEGGKEGEPSSIVCPNASALAAFEAAAQRGHVRRREDILPRVRRRHAHASKLPLEHWARSSGGATPAVTPSSALSPSSGGPRWWLSRSIGPITVYAFILRRGFRSRGFHSRVPFASRSVRLAWTAPGVCPWLACACLARLWPIALPNPPGGLCRRESVIRVRADTPRAASCFARPSIGAELPAAPSRVRVRLCAAPNCYKK